MKETAVSSYCTLWKTNIRTRQKTKRQNKQILLKATSTLIHLAQPSHPTVHKASLSTISKQDVCIGSGESGVSLETRLKSDPFKDFLLLEHICCRTFRCLARFVVLWHF